LDTKATAQIRHVFCSILEASLKAIVEVIPQSAFAAYAYNTPLEE
jgi:hypothetical protein